MLAIEKTIFINRPRQVVWDFISNPANNSQWRNNESVEWISEGPPAVGSTQRAVEKFLGRKIENISEIIVWDPPNELGQKSVGGPMPFEFTMKIEPEGNGTQLIVSGTAEIGGFFKIAEGLVAKQFEKQVDTELDALKLLLEAGQV